ncbi:MAG: hypothetical protein FWH57_00505 [Oscillospiraceae bacterium]|nr:hypothetical protein [Oscillospiraceae bacterium]
MDEDREPADPTDEQEGQEKKTEKQKADIGYKESFYDKIPLTKKQLNVIIIILIIAVIVFFVLGALIGNGVI